MKPFKISFLPARPGQDQSSIVARFSLAGVKYKFFPGISVRMSDWSKAKQRVDHRKDMAWDVNDRINRVEKAIKNAVTAFQVNQITGISQKQMNFAIEAEIRRLDSADGTMDTSEFVEDFAKFWIPRKAAKKKDNNYLRRWNTTVRNSVELRPNLRFQDIDEDFFREYVNYLIEEQDNINNTIAGKVKRMKQLCREAIKYGHKVNPHFEDFMFREERVPAIFLYWEEVESLERLTELSEQERYIRDRFIFRCYTGIRYSDMEFLHPGMITMNRGIRVLRFDQVKTSTANAIFLPDKAFMIWKSWDMEINKHVTWNHLQIENELIKILLRRTKVEREVQIVRHQGSKTISEIKQIHEVVSTHTARRTMARAWYDRGGDLNKLREHLGHIDLNTTLRYIGIERNETNIEAARLFG